MKILTVDFNNLFNRLVGEKLERYGNTVSNHTVTNIEQAKEMIALDRPDLTIIEFNLRQPEYSKSLFRRLRSLELDFMIIVELERSDIYDDIFHYRPSAIFSIPLDIIGLMFHIDTLIQKMNMNKVVESTIKDDYFVFKWNSQLVKERYSEIKYVQAEGNYITLYVSNREYLIRKSLKNMCTLLPSSKFAQIHRNFVININFMRSINISKNLIDLGDMTLPVGRKYKGDIIDLFSRTASTPSINSIRHYSYS